MAGVLAIDLDELNGLCVQLLNGGARNICSVLTILSRIDNNNSYTLWIELSTYFRAYFEQIRHQVCRKRLQSTRHVEPTKSEPRSAFPGTSDRPKKIADGFFPFMRGCQTDKQATLTG